MNLFPGLVLEMPKDDLVALACRRFCHDQIEIYIPGDAYAPRRVTSPARSAAESEDSLVQQ